MLTITGEIAPVTINVYTNGTVIVNVFTVTGAISPVIVNVYTKGSVYTKGCYIGCYSARLEIEESLVRDSLEALYCVLEQGTLSSVRYWFNT